VPCLRPLNQTARAVFPQAAFLCCSTLESSRDKTGNELGQSHQTELPDQPPGWLPAPPPMAPALRQTRLEAVLDPAVEPMEEPPHIRLAREGPPPPYDGIDPLDHFAELQGRLPSREGSKSALGTAARTSPEGWRTGSRGWPGRGACAPGGGGLRPASPGSPGTRSLG